MFYGVYYLLQIEICMCAFLQTQAVQYCNRMVLLRVFALWQSQQKCRLTEYVNLNIFEVLEFMLKLFFFSLSVL